MITRDFLGNVWDIDCMGCAIGASVMVPPGGIIAENDSCFVHQDPEVPLEGFLIISPRRHVQSLTEFTAEDYADFVALMRFSRNALRLISDIHSITMIQEEESAHFHLWLFPWYEWMINQYGSVSLTHIRPIMASAKQTLNSPQQIQSILEWVEHLRQAKDSIQRGPHLHSFFMKI